MKREPTDQDQEKIDRAILDGNRIEATSLYISITECGLTEAQQFIKARTVELQTTPLEAWVLIFVPRHLLSYIPRVLRFDIRVKRLLYNIIH